VRAFAAWRQDENMKKGQLNCHNGVFELARAISAWQEAPRTEAPGPG
jgi:hypothetical protein